MSQLVPVTFLVPDGPYNAGETAGFPANVAKRLVDRKVAKLFVSPSANAATATLASGLEVKEDTTLPSLEPALLAAEERKRLPDVPAAPLPVGEEVPTSEAAIADGKLGKRKRK